MSSLYDLNLLAHLKDPANHTLVDDVKVELELARIRRRNTDPRVLETRDYLARLNWASLCTRVVTYDNGNKRARWCKHVCQKILPPNSDMIKAILDFLQVPRATEDDFLTAIKELPTSKAHSNGEASFEQSKEHREYLLCRRFIKYFVERAAQDYCFLDTIEHSSKSDFEGGSAEDYHPIWADTPTFTKSTHTTSSSISLGPPGSTSLSTTHPSMPIDTIISEPAPYVSLGGLHSGRAGLGTSLPHPRPTPLAQVTKLLDEPYFGPDAQLIPLDTVIPQPADARYHSASFHDVKLTLRNKKDLNMDSFHTHLKFLLIYMMESGKYVRGEPFPMDKKRMTLRVSPGHFARGSFIGDALWDDEVANMTVRTTGVKDDVEFIKAVIRLFKTNSFSGFDQDARGYWYGHPKVEEHNCGSIQEIKFGISFEINRGTLRKYLDDEYGHIARRLRVEWNILRSGNVRGCDGPTSPAFTNSLTRQILDSGTLPSCPDVGVRALSKRLRRQLESRPKSLRWEINAGRSSIPGDLWDPHKKILLLSGAVSRFYGTVQQGGEYEPPIRQQRSYWANFADSLKPGNHQGPEDSPINNAQVTSEDDGSRELKEVRRRAKRAQSTLQTSTNTPTTLVDASTKPFATQAKSKRNRRKELATNNQNIPLP